MSIELPSSSQAEAATAIAKGAVSAIPIVGGVVSEVGNLYLNPLEKRKQRWVTEVTSAINEIQQRFSILATDLQNDERFVSFLYQATIVALKNHRNEKIAALKNALIAAASPRPLTEDLAFQFLKYVDDLTPTHLQILHCLDAKKSEFAGLHNIEDVFKTFSRVACLPVERITFRMFLHDLDARFLLRIGDLDDLPEFKSRISYRTLQDSSIKDIEVTSLGHDFLRFIAGADRPSSES